MNVLVFFIPIKRVSDKACSMVDILLFCFLVYVFFIFFIHSFTTDHSIFCNDQKHKTIDSAIMVSTFYKINNIFLFAINQSSRKIKDRNGLQLAGNCQCPTTSINSTICLSSRNGSDEVDNAISLINEMGGIIVREQGQEYGALRAGVTWQSK